VSKIFLSVAAAAATILAASEASAATAIIDGITVNDYGRVNPAGPDFAQSGSGTGTAQIQVGQVTSGPPNPTPFDNPGWNPYGLSDTSHPWWNIEGGQVTMNGSGNGLTIVWGSPNDNNPAATNRDQHGIVLFWRERDGLAYRSSARIGPLFELQQHQQYPGPRLPRVFSDAGEVRQCCVHDRLE
jgi:hypothetical protein